MRICEEKDNKKQYLDLLLLADEQEDMIDRYLDRGTMYILKEGGARAECVVTREESNILEIKNLAVDPAWQRRGCGRALIDFLVKTYAGQYAALRVGTGDSPLTIPFYEACGFHRVGRKKNFFLEHYDHSIYECGVRLTDMIYLERTL